MTLLRGAASAALLCVLCAISSGPTSAQTGGGPVGAPAASSVSGSDATTTTLDLLPPEVPPTRRTLPPETVPETSSTSTTTSSVLSSLSSSGDPTLGPVCASAANAAPALGRPCRVIAFYGTPAAPSMGILGRLPLAVMVPTLQATTALWAAADPSTTTTCAFEVISMVAQRAPGPSGLYRARINAAQLDSMVALARANGCLTLIDLQVGRSSVPVELPQFLPWLRQPDVHLALDPEWDMPPGVVPGTQIGSMTAEDINSAITLLSSTVRDLGLPPKLLVVHRFRDFMIANPERVAPTPQVRLLVNMDGFGPPTTKLGSYARVRQGLTTTLTGFKLFTRNDRPMLAPNDVLGLQPPPMFINYQ